MKQKHGEKKNFLKENLKNTTAYQRQSNSPIKGGASIVGIGGISVANISQRGNKSRAANTADGRDHSNDKSLFLKQ